MAARQKITNNETRQATSGSPANYAYGPGEEDYVASRMRINGAPAAGPLINPAEVLHDYAPGIKMPTPQEFDDYLMGRPPPPAQFMPDAQTPLFRRATTTADAGTIMNDAGGMQMPGGAPPMMPQSNTLGKGDMGQDPGMMSYMLNSLMAMLGGTQFNRDPNAMSYGPERTMGGQPIPAAPMAPPMPEPNPQTMPMSPEEMELGQIFAMTHPSQVGPFPAPPVMPPLPAGGFQTTTEPIPPVPTKKAEANKPQRVTKKEKDGKPQRYQGKGTPSKSEPKQVTPPPRKKR